MVRMLAEEKDGKVRPAGWREASTGLVQLVDKDGNILWQRYFVLARKVLIFWSRLPRILCSRQFSAPNPPFRGLQRRPRKQILPPECRIQRILTAIEHRSPSPGCRGTRSGNALD